MGVVPRRIKSEKGCDLMTPQLRGFISLSETTRAIVDSESESIIISTPAIPFLIADQSEKGPILVVTHSSQRASSLATELSEMCEGILEFPAWETLPHERLSPNNDTVAKRISALMNLESARVVVTTARALIQPIISTINETPAIRLEIGAEFDFEKLTREITDCP